MAVSVISDATALTCTSIGTAPSSTQLSVCFWFKLTSGSAGYQSLFSIEPASGGYYATLEMNPSEQLFMERYDAVVDNYTSTFKTLTAGVWYFVCGQIDGTGAQGDTVRYYVWAVDDTSPSTDLEDTTLTPGAITFTRFKLGSQYITTGNVCNGCFTALKVWTAVTLTQEDFERERWFIEPQKTAGLWTWNPLVTIGDLNDYSGGSTARNLSGGSATVDGPPIAWTRSRGSSILVPASSDLIASPQAASSTWTALDPTIAAGDATVTPSAAAATLSANDPTIAAAVTVTPTEASSAWTAIDPATAQGGVTANPAEATATWTANDPTIAVGGVSVAPVEATSTWTALDPSASAGSDPQTANPSEAISTWSALDPTVAVGGVTTTPTEASSAWSANDPTIVSAVTIAPAEAVSTWSANDPSAFVSGTAAPEAAISTWSALDPSIAVGGIVVVPTEAAAAWSANDPTIVAAVVIAPAEGIASWSANDPTTVQGGVTVLPDASISSWIALDPIAFGDGTPQTAQPLAATCSWSAFTPEVLHGPKITGWLSGSPGGTKFRQAQNPSSRFASSVQNQASEDGLR